MATILEEILEAKRREVMEQRRQVPLAEVEARARALPPPLNFSGALMGEGVRLIAEAKRASPSRGVLRRDYDPVALALTYAQNGAAAVSVLTDGPYFGGSLEDLSRVKEALAPHRLPVLRKDFILDPYQIYEARAAGADAVLLIAAVLEGGRLKELLQVARELWVQCLVEVHDAPQVHRALEAGAEVIGINNRDLRTFHTDLRVTEELRPLIPRGKVVVSESGIATAQDVARLRRAGVHAVLVGEALVTAPDVAAKVRELVNPMS